MGYLRSACFIVCKFFFFNVYLFSRERQTETECEWRRVRERERGDTESEAGSRFGAVSTEPDTGLELTNRELKLDA